MKCLIGVVLALGMVLVGCSPPASTPIDAGSDAVADASAADGGPTWDVVLEHLDGALLSMWGTSKTDVWSVGGPRGNQGFDSLVIHFDGAKWTRLRPGGTETFWWVHGSSANDVWMVGEQGRTTHWDGAAFKELPRITTATLFGVWSASPTDAWAVGGTPEGAAGSPNDVLLHWDGTTWSPSPFPQALGRTLFKVWGTSSENLYAVGEAGTIWHRVGTTWTLESNPPLAHGTLLTVHGCSANEVYAVGGRDVLRSDGKKWSRVDLTLLNDVNGVSCAKPGEAVIVGFGGLKWRLVAGEWVDDFGTKPYADLHGAWSDPSGAYFGVGGDFISRSKANASREGIIGRYGRDTVPSTLMP